MSTWRTEIIALYWSRSQEAIGETAKKYGAYCAAIIRRVLGDGRDQEECLMIPGWGPGMPYRPSGLVRLAVFLGRIARNTALDRYSYNTAQCRSSAGLEAVLEELAECVSGVSMEDDLELRQLGRASPATWPPSHPARWVFLRQYFHCESIQGNCRSLELHPLQGDRSLHRTRKGLQVHLRKEGYDP